jgi:hypothetical protein
MEHITIEDIEDMALCLGIGRDPSVLELQRIADALGIGVTYGQVAALWDRYHGEGKAWITN